MGYMKTTFGNDTMGNNIGNNMGNNMGKIFFPLLYTLQASISKPMAITNSNRHAFDGRTYRKISNQIPIRDPMGSTIPEASGFLITIKRSLNQN